MGRWLLVEVGTEPAPDLLHLLVRGDNPTGGLTRPDRPGQFDVPRLCHREVLELGVRPGRYAFQLGQLDVVFGQAGEDSPSLVGAVKRRDLKAVPAQWCIQAAGRAVDVSDQDETFLGLTVERVGWVVSD